MSSASQHRGRVNRAVGDAAEEAFERHARTLGYTVDRVQPATRRVWGKDGALLHITLSGAAGVWDYTGYDRDGRWLAVEVKAAKGGTMPASRLSIAQRAWAEGKPKDRLLVAIFWEDYGRMEMHNYIQSGIYRRIDRSAE